MAKTTTKHPPADRVLESICDGLETLDLGEVRKALEESLAQPADDRPRLEWLWCMLEPQVRKRLEARVARRFRDSHLPEKKTLAPGGFDFSFQPSLDRDLVLELATLRFLDQGKNVLLAGMSGTGKSHIAKALGLAACVANRRVLYTTSAALLAKLRASLADDSLSRALRPYVNAELLIIDEVGLEQVERQDALRSGLFQKVLLPRYDKLRSTIITSNIPWEAWGDYLQDHLGATAVVDRLIHHSHIIVIDGPSWREHEHKREVSASRAPPSQPPAASSATVDGATKDAPTQKARSRRRAARSRS